jgi:hypothetical protein
MWEMMSSHEKSWGHHADITVTSGNSEAKVEPAPVSQKVRYKSEFAIFNVIFEFFSLIQSQWYIYVIYLFGDERARCQRR